MQYLKKVSSNNGFIKVYFCLNKCMPYYHIQVRIIYISVLCCLFPTTGNYPFFNLLYLIVLTTTWRLYIMKPYYIMLFIHTSVHSPLGS
jgi:hypothetical protein